METKSTNMVAVAVAIFVAVTMLGTILVPVIYDASHTTITVTNEGAGDLRYAYYDESTAYTSGVSYDDTEDEITFGVGSASPQTIAATDTICWASDVGSIIYADGGFTLLYEVEDTVTAVDLGESYAITGYSSGGVGIAGNGLDTIEIEEVSWEYTPDASGSFGFFTESGATVDAFPVATIGSFAGAYAYNEINSLAMSDIVPTYSVSDGVFTAGDWELQEGEVVAVGSPYVSIYATVSTPTYNAAVDPSTGTLVDDLYYTFSGTEAAVVGISSALSSATSIVIPNTVTSGGTTYNVTSISSGNSQATGVFAGLTSLQTITLSENLTSIGSYAFFRCTNLALTSLPDGVTSISSQSFISCTNLALTSLPDGVTSIGSQSFAGCTNLALTSLPDGVTSIGSNAFDGCTNLALTSLPDGVTSIGNYTFTSCTNLALTSLPDGVTSIGSSTFANCTNLALTSLPDGVTSIGSFAFVDCSSLTGSLILPDGLTTIKKHAFEGTGYTGIIVLGSPSFGEDSLNVTNVGEVLNLGTTALNPGDYGLPSTATVGDEILSLGYIAPVSYSETVENEGAAYVLLGIIPVIMILAILMMAVTPIIRRD